MNAIELVTRLESLPESTVPSFVVITDGSFVRYGIDSVADDGTFIVVPIEMLNLEVRTTDGAVSGDSDWHGSVVHEVQDDREEDERPGD